MSNNKIKIFVSHRKDLKSETINNPLYCHVTCGAALRKSHKGTIGDNIGDNISKKQPFYSEFTVQYWAWKNCKADYYGLCHYRRYLSFANKMFPEWNEQRFAAEETISNKSIKKYGLLNSKKMEKEINKYDVITSVTYEVDKIPNVPKFKNVYEAFVNSPALFTSKESVDKLRNIVKEKFPQYFQELEEELNSDLHRGFNCFVMKKELFFKMCEFQFGTLFELEGEIDLNARAGNNIRELGYLGEILYGAFVRWVIKQKIYKVKETQIILFLNTEKKNHKPFFKQIGNSFKNILFPNYKRIKNITSQQNYQNYQIEQILSNLNAINENINSIKQQNSILFFSQQKEFPADLEKAKLTFWQSFPKATGDLRIVQQANSKLLKNFAVICDKNNCSFWLHGGSLIGGLRHSGFVPWDGDIDIAMMREDFEKICRYLQGENSIYEIKNYYYIELGCRSYRFRRKDLGSNCFVDIFVYDNYELKYGDKMTDWQDLCGQKKRIRAQSISICRENNLNPQEPTLRGFNSLKKDLDIIFNKYIEKNKSANDTSFILWGLDNNYEDETRYAWHHGRIFKREDIFPFKKVIYEGIECNIPNNFEKYAIAEYGYSYLEMPPNFGSAIHWQQYFNNQEQIELAKKIIEDDIIC